MTLAMSATREKFPLSPKKPLKKTTVALIAWSLLMALSYGGFLAFSLNGFGTVLGGWIAPVSLGIIALWLLIAVSTYVYQLWYYQTYFYDLTDSFVIIRKGVITPREITIPYERIQDVYVDQDVFDRLFGLYDVHLSTATVSSAMEAHIDGVEQPASEGLRQILLTTINAKIAHRSSPPTTNG